MCSHYTDQCTTLKEIIKKAKRKKAKYNCPTKKKTYTKLEVHRKKPRTEELRNFKETAISDGSDKSFM